MWRCALHSSKLLTRKAGARWLVGHVRFAGRCLKSSTHRASDSIVIGQSVGVLLGGGSLARSSGSARRPLASCVAKSLSVVGTLSKVVIEKARSRLLARPNVPIVRVTGMAESATYSPLSKLLISPAFGTPMAALLFTAAMTGLRHWRSGLRLASLSHPLSIGLLRRLASGTGRLINDVIRSTQPSTTGTSMAKARRLLLGSSSRISSSNDRRLSWVSSFMSDFGRLPSRLIGLGRQSTAIGCAR